MEALNRDIKIPATHVVVKTVNNTILGKLQRILTDEMMEGHVEYEFIMCTHPRKEAGEKIRTAQIHPGAVTFLTSEQAAAVEAKMVARRL